MAQMHAVADLHHASDRYAVKSLPEEIIGRQCILDLRYIANLLLRWLWLAGLAATLAAWLFAANGSTPGTAWAAAAGSSLAVAAVVLFLDILLASLKSWD